MAAHFWIIIAKLSRCKLRCKSNALILDNKLNCDRHILLRAHPKDGERNSLLCRPNAYSFLVDAPRGASKQANLARHYGRRCRLSTWERLLRLSRTIRRGRSTTSENLRIRSRRALYFNQVSRLRVILRDNTRADPCMSSPSWTTLYPNVLLMNLTFQTFLELPCQAARPVIVATPAGALLSHFFFF